MRLRPSATGLLAAGLAVAYGMIVGTWLPVPPAGAVYALPAAVVASPLPREAAADLESAGLPAEAPRALPTAWLPAGAGAFGEGDPGSPVRFTGFAASKPGGLPAAPAFVVAPLPGASAARPGVIRFADGGGGSPAGSGGCPAIVGEGDFVPPECRRAAQRRLQALCPPPAERSRGGPVACIRAVD